MSNKKNVYEVVIGDLPDYEELVAFIYLSNPLSNQAVAKLLADKSSILSKMFIPGKYKATYAKSEEIAMVHTEEGRDKMKIRFSKYASKNDLDLDEVIKAIDKAKKRLSN